MDVATRKAERDVKLAKEEANNFKSKADEMEAKWTRVYTTRVDDYQSCNLS